MDLQLRECYVEMQKSCDIEVGDTVKVLRKAKDFELGWFGLWASEMDDFIEKTLTVTEENINTGFECDGGYYFPWFVLEKVKPKINLTDIETVKRLHKEMWLWMAEEPKARKKKGWPGWEKYEICKDIVLNECFLCQYCDGECNECPGRWGNYSLIHGISRRSRIMPCEQGEFGFYIRERLFIKQVLKRIYMKIANICD